MSVNVANVGSPVGSGEHVVRAGECIDSIAYEHGFFGETLWNHPDNAELKRVRKHPNVLLAGDRVAIPDLRKKTESGAMDTRHRFRRKGVPAMLRLQILWFGTPRGDDDYIIDIDGQKRSGSLDGEGWLEEPISPAARVAVLEVGTDRQRFEIQLGGTDPIDTIRGVQHRLNNIGFACGEPDGELGDRTRAALGRFQKSQGLKETGEPDQGTLDALLRVHHS